MFTLRFPFKLPDGRFISPLDTPVEMTVNGLNYHLSRGSFNTYILKISSFKDEHSAKEFIPNIFTGMAWALLRNELSADFELEPQSVEYSEDPAGTARNIFGKSTHIQKIDALIDGHRPSITLTHKKISLMTAGDASVSTGVNANKTLESITEAASFPKAAIVYSNPKLKIAIDLFNTYFRENSANARFLTLTMALETLTQSEEKTIFVRKLIEQWITDIQQHKSCLDPETDEWNQLDSLEKDVFHRKDVSIRKKIRTLVQNALFERGELIANETAKRAVKLYDKRSRLVHDGYLPEDELRKGINELKDIVCSVLQSKIAELSQ